MKIKKALAATLAFVLLLCIVYYVHARFLRVDVVFYSAIADALFAAMLAGGGLFYLHYFSVLSYFEKAQLVLIWVLAGYAFAISVPTVIDRSLSFYMLEKLQQRGGGIQVESMPEVFTEEYMKEYRLIDIRLTEQLQSGTIYIEDGCVKLTGKGKLIASFGQLFRRHLLPKNRLLMGEYTDVLTEPFRFTSEDPGYTCQ